MTPPSPVGVTAARSTPRSFASLRTGGLASGRLSGSFAPWPLSSAWTAAAAGPGICAPLRARRLVEVSATPYPTSTGWRPLGASGSASGAASATGCWTASAAAGTSPLPGATSTAMITSPTSTVVPSGKRSSCTTPSNGIGSSTAALAVSTSHTTCPSVTVSPGWTNHLRISASVSPSPTSGILNSRKRADVSVIVVTTLSSVRQ